jgi:hypothetical protein
MKDGVCKMATQLTVTLPDEISEQAQAVAELTERPVEQVVIEHLRSLRAPDSALPSEIRSELEALRYLSDDALWLIAREHLPERVQTRADELLGDRRQTEQTDAERHELAEILDRADRVMLRKAEAAVLLRRRGHTVTLDALRPRDE